MPKETIERIEAVKGPYMTRGKYILKAVDRLLQEEEEEEEKQLVAVAAVGALLVRNKMSAMSLLRATVHPRPSISATIGSKNLKSHREWRFPGDEVLQ